MHEPRYDSRGALSLAASRATSRCPRTNGSEEDSPHKIVRVSYCPPTRPSNPCVPEYRVYITRWILSCTVAKSSPRVRPYRIVTAYQALRPPVSSPSSFSASPLVESRVQSPAVSVGQRTNPPPLRCALLSRLAFHPSSTRISNPRFVFVPYVCHAVLDFAVRYGSYSNHPSQLHPRVAFLDSALSLSYTLLFCLLYPFVP